MIREIRLLGDPILRRATDPVERFDEELASFLDDLVETMYHAEGVGLAAPQVGDSRRATVIDVSEERDGSRVLELVNPRILGTEGTIATVRPEHFRDFYARHYVPSNMTLLAVCDCEPTLVVDRIRQELIRLQATDVRQ